MCRVFLREQGDKRFWKGCFSTPVLQSGTSSMCGTRAHTTPKSCAPFTISQPSLPTRDDLHWTPCTPKAAVVISHRKNSRVLKLHHMLRYGFMVYCDCFYPARLQTWKHNPRWRVRTVFSNLLSHLPGRNRSQDVPVLLLNSSFLITPHT